MNSIPREPFATIHSRIKKWTIRRDAVRCSFLTTFAFEELNGCIGCHSFEGERRSRKWFALFFPFEAWMARHTKTFIRSLLVERWAMKPIEVCMGMLFAAEEASAAIAILFAVQQAWLAASFQFREHLTSVKSRSTWFCDLERCATRRLMPAEHQFCRAVVRHSCNIPCPAHLSRFNHS